jgi:hypothetical protein
MSIEDIENGRIERIDDVRMDLRSINDEIEELEKSNREFFQDAVHHYRNRAIKLLDIPLTESGWEECIEDLEMGVCVLGAAVDACFKNRLLGGA